MTADTNHEAFWHHAARRVRTRVNIGFVLQRYLPAVLALTLLQGCLLLVLRRLEAPLLPLWTAYAAALAAAPAICAWSCRHRFFSFADALVYLEIHLSLKNRLTAARDGQASWPPAQPLPPFFRWSWQRLLLPPAAAGAFLLLAGWTPIKSNTSVTPQAPAEPLAWQEIESWAETLEERDLFEKDTLAQWEEQVQALRDQPVQDWYSHSSLEAGDNLRDNVAGSIRELHSALTKAEYPLSIARDALDTMPAGLQPLLQEHWREALSAMDASDLKLNKELLSQLRAVDFSNLQTLSQETIDRLARMLREGQLACEHSMGGECKNPGDPCGICPGGVCQGQGNVPGRGGVGRGPGAAPLSFHEFPSLVDSQRREAVSNDDLSRAALGEQIGATETAPEVDPAMPTGPLAAGTAVLASEGGEAVFHSRLTPAEQQRLQKYFK